MRISPKIQYIPLFTGGIERSTGLFYLQFLNHYQYSSTVTAWICSLASCLRFILGTYYLKKTKYDYVNWGYFAIKSRNNKIKQPLFQDRRPWTKIDTIKQVVKGPEKMRTFKSDNNQTYAYNEKKRETITNTTTLSS